MDSTEPPPPPGGSEAKPNTLTVDEPMLRVRDLIERAVEAHMTPARSASSLSMDAIARLRQRYAAYEDRRRQRDEARWPKDQPRDELKEALAAFISGELWVLIDGRRANSLEELVPLAEAQRVTFLRRIPLEGG